jgi:hypothetical protein
MCTCKSKIRLQGMEAGAQDRERVPDVMAPG